MILFCVLIVIVALFSRLIALLIAVPYVARLVFSDIEQEIPHTTQSPALLRYLVIITAICAVLVVVKVLPLMQALEIWVSIGATPIVFASALQKYKFEIAFLIASSPALIYIILKNLMFFPQIKLVIEESNQLFMSSLEKMLSPEMMESMYPTLESIKSIMLNGNAAVWMISAIGGLLFGALIYFRKKSHEWHFRDLKFPYYLQLGLVVGLVLFIFKIKIISYNVLFIVGLFYLIQGYSVLYCYVESILSRNKFLGIVMLVIPIFSYILLLVITFAGLLDNWLPIRKFAYHRGDKE